MKKINLAAFLLTAGISNALANEIDLTHLSATWATWQHGTIEENCAVFLPTSGSDNPYAAAAAEIAAEIAGTPPRFNPHFVQIVDLGDFYRVSLNIRADDELQFRLWSAGGYTQLLTVDGEQWIATPALSNVSDPYLSAIASLSGNRTPVLWMEDFRFNELERIFTAEAEIERQYVFEFLIDRAETGSMYIIVPSQLGSGKAFALNTGTSFRAALAGFIRCQESEAG